MLKIEAYVRPSSLPAFHAALMTAGVKGLTVWETRGIGQEHETKPKRFRGAEIKQVYIQRVRIDMVVEDAEKDGVIKAITDLASSSPLGTVRLFVTPVLEAIRIPPE